MVVVLVLLFEDRKAPEAETIEVEGPAFTRYLFSNTRAGLIWLPIRLFLGFEWAVAGWEKISGTGWTDGGAALLGYWKSAVRSRPRACCNHVRVVSDLPAVPDRPQRPGLDGLGRLGWRARGGDRPAARDPDRHRGVLRGDDEHVVLLAGSASVNPIMFAFTIGLILAWKVAGYYGFDRYLLPRLGVPWHGRPGPTTVAPGVAPATT